MSRTSVEYQRLQNELTQLRTLLDVEGALSEVRSGGLNLVSVKLPDDADPRSIEAQAAFLGWERRFRKVVEAIFGSQGDPALPELETEGSRFLRARLNGLKYRRYLDELLEDVDVFGAARVRIKRFAGSENAAPLHPSERWEHSNTSGVFQCTIPWSADAPLRDTIETVARTMGSDVAIVTRVREGALCQVRPGFETEELAREFKRRVHDALRSGNDSHPRAVLPPSDATRRYQVFVSSTYEDLKHERQVAVMAILEAGHIPAGMELFAAGDKGQMEVIERWIRESDIFMLLLGSRYGSIDPSSNNSYIQREFEIASALGKPSFVLELPEDEAVRRMRDPVHGTKSTDFERLSKFRQALRSSRIVAPWTNDDAIRAGVLKSLANITPSLPPSAGWFRIDAPPVRKDS